MPGAQPASDSARTTNGLRSGRGVVPASYNSDETPVLTVDAAIQACLQSDPKLAAAWEAVPQAQADWVTASLKPNPKLGLSQTGMPLGRQYSADAPGGPAQLDAGIEMPIDWFLFGKRAAAMASAHEAWHAAEFDYQDQVRQRVLETATAYFDLIEAQALFRLARESLENLLQVEAATAKAEANGGRPRVELQRIRLDVLAGRQALREAERDQVVAKAALRALLGRIGTEADFSVPDSVPDPLASEPLPLEAAFAEAQENRPDLQALQWKLSKGQADIELECRNGKPEITPRIGLSRQFQEKMGFPDASGWGVGLDLALPVYNRNQGNRLKAISAAAQAEYELEAGRLALYSEVEAATHELQAATENATAIAAEQLRLAEDVRDSITRSYQAGGRPLIEVLDAQRNYRDTYRLYVTARVGYWRAYYGYNATIGRQVLR